MVVYIWEDPLEKGTATYSSILASRIPLNRGAWQAAVHGVAESDTTERLSLNVCVNATLSVHPSLPPLGAQVHSLHLHLYSCPPNRFISTIFLDSVYMYCWLLLSRSVVSDSLQPRGLQHTRLSCPSPSPGACSDSCPLNRWCHPTISSSLFFFLSYFTLCGRL